MKYTIKRLIDSLRRYKISGKKKVTSVVFSSILIFGFSVQTQAGIFDDIGDIFDDIIDVVAEIFSSAKNVAETVVEKIDTTVIANVTGRCTTVKAENESGDTETSNVIQQCGHSVVELKDIFEDLGGEIADQAKEVEETLSEVAQDKWNDVSESFVVSVEDLISVLGNAAFDPIKDLSRDLLDGMNNVKSTLSGFTLPKNSLEADTNLNLFYTKNFGKATLELIIRGTVGKNITEGGVDFMGLDGKLIAKLKTSSVVGYNPQAYVQLEYVNPIIKIEDGSITGILVLQPDGAIKLAGAVLPLQFAAGLAQLIDTVPKLKNIAVLQSTAKAVSVQADIGTIGFSVPLTNQADSRFNFDLSVSGGVDAAVKITNSWRVKIAERVTWKQNIALDIPSIQLPLGAVPAGVIGKLESDPEPSYAEQIVAYSFHDSGSDIIEDSSSYAHHARIVGGVTLRDGAAYLNGSDGYIDLPDDLMRGLNAITVYTEVFINEEQATPYFIYGLGNSNGELGDGYLFTTGDEYRSALSGCHWICEQSIFAEHLKVPRGSWQKLVYTVKENRATLYLNGDIVNQITDMTLKPNDIGNGRTTANYIGRSLYSGDHYFNGAIREFEIWNDALTHDEVAEKYGRKNTITVHAGGAVGGEKISLLIDGSSFKTWTLSTSMKDYTITTAARGDLRVAFINDAENRDVRVDFVKVNDKVHQAELQDDNTGVWANESCGGGGKSEWLHCNGSIGFGNILGD